MDDNHIDYLIQRAGECHLIACEDHEAVCDEIGDPFDWPPSPASAPFCGCEKCVTREVLVGAWPAIEQHIIAPLKRDVRARFWCGCFVGFLWAGFCLLLGFAIGFFELL